VAGQPFSKILARLLDRASIPLSPLFNNLSPLFFFFKERNLRRMDFPDFQKQRPQGGPGPALSEADLPKKVDAKNVRGLISSLMELGR